MKKVMKGLWVGSLAMSLLASSALVVRADDEKQSAGDSPAAMGGQGGDPDGMGGGMMGGGAERMKEKLGLSDSQATQLKTLFKKQMEGNKPLRDQMRIDMDTLQQRVDLKASDSDIKKLLDKLEAERKEMDSSREKMKDQLKTILSPTQQAKMVLGMRAKGMQMMGKWMKRHKGGMNKEKDSSSDAPGGDQDSNTGK
jgi:Spy/CpxP family protein refolding chaperone